MSEIKITAEPSNIPQLCSFIVSEELYPKGTLVCSNRLNSYGSPLLEEIFLVEGVVEVAVTNNLVTVKKDSPQDWEDVAPLIGNAIRKALEKNVPLFKENIEEILKKSAEKPIPSKFSAPEEKIIYQLLEEKINPAIAAHGGHIDLLRVEDHVAYIKMSGGCQGCHMALQTLKRGVEVAIKEALPSILDIVDETDHASGENPYY
jgi:Fe-S cluster biogenesis protein NfuA